MRLVGTRALGAFEEQVEKEVEYRMMPTRMIMDGHGPRTKP
jgi:hypothetical protein